MPKIQKVIQRLFTNIFPDDFKPGEYEFFLDFDNKAGIDESKDLKSLKEIYENIVNENLTNFIILSKVEETIIQIRCKEVIDRELRLSQSREYIYARSLFYRRGHDINDIRVLMGKTGDYGELSDLESNVHFINECKEKLLAVMDKEIQSNLDIIKSKLQYEDIELI